MYTYTVYTCMVVPLGFPLYIHSLSHALFHPLSISSLFIFPPCVREYVCDGR